MRIELTQEHLRIIYDSVNTAIFVQDLETGATLDVNQRMCELFHFTREQALQQNLGTLGLGLQPYRPEDAEAWIQKAADEGLQAFEWLAKDSAGHLLWLEVSMGPLQLAGRKQMLITVRDITDRKRADADNAARLKRAEAQNAVSLALAGVGLSLEEAVRLLARHLAAQMGDLCVLDILDEGGLLQPMAVDQPYIDGAALLPALTDLEALPLGHPGAGEAALTGQSLRLAEADLESIAPLVRPQFRPYLERYAIHSLLIVPGRHQGRVIATFLLAKGGSSKPYTVEDLAVLQNLADRSALTITNAKLYAENLRQAEELREVNAELEQRVAERTAELADANARLQRLAALDGLTGIANRRTFDTALDAEVRRARRSGDPLSLIMCDVDFFKRYNDCYGHPGGDACLQTVGQVLRDIFKRAGELPARYGGEEFAVVLPNVPREQACKVAERLRLALVERNLPHQDSTVAPCVTLSIGVVTAHPGPETAPEWFVQKADEALYRSKSEGRNRVTCVD